MCTLQDFEWMAMTEYSREALRKELDTWHTDYLPIGKTVLDVGAGCGETAQLYLNHGAEKVICIEANPAAIECLKKNFGKDDRVVIVPAFIDSIKIDIEGGEEGMVFETHFPFRLQSLRSWGDVRIWRLRRGRFAWRTRLHKMRINSAHKARLFLDRNKQS